MKKQKILSICLAFAMASGLLVTAGAAETGEDTAIDFYKGSSGLATDGFTYTTSTTTAVTYKVGSDYESLIRGAKAGDTVTISYKLNAAGDVNPRAAFKIGNRKFIWTLTASNGNASSSDNYNIYTNLNGGNQTTITYTLTLADGGEFTKVVAHVVNGNVDQDVYTIDNINDTLELNLSSVANRDKTAADITLTDFRAVYTPGEGEADNQAIKVTAIGDSITYGYGLSDSDRGTYGYPAVLNTLLNSTDNAYVVYNRGKNSRTMGSTNYPYMSEQEWKSAQADKSDIYIIGLGTNDSKNGVEDDNKYNYKYVKDGTYAEKYMTMIDTLMKCNSSAEIYLIIPIPSIAQTQESADDEGDINEARLTVVREKVRDVYTQAYKKYGDRIKLIDLFTAFTSVINGQTLAEANIDKYTNPTYAAGSETSFNAYATANGLYLYDKNMGSGSDSILIDTIHPGKAGYRLIAETVFKAITGITEIPEPAHDPVHYSVSRDTTYAFVFDDEKGETVEVTDDNAGVYPEDNTYSVVGRGISYTVTANDDTIKSITLTAKGSSVFEDGTKTAEYTVGTTITSGIVKIGAVVTGTNKTIKQLYNETASANWELTVNIE